MTLVQKFRTVVALLPAVLEAIKTVEQMFPHAKIGNFKLALVRSMLEVHTPGNISAEASFESIWPAIQRCISVVVALRKHLGE